MLVLCVSTSESLEVRSERAMGKGKILAALCYVNSSQLTSLCHDSVYLFISFVKSF